MNRVTAGQASCLSCSAGFQPALAGKMPALRHRQDACAAFGYKPAFCVLAVTIAWFGLWRNCHAISPVRKERAAQIR